MAGTIAVVTGATGYVATQLTKQLLEKGYTVRGTVRSTHSERVATLNRLGEALPGTLTLHQADLLKPGAFDEVVKGSQLVFHTASPFINKVEDNQRDLVDPAVNGTKNVLGAVAKSKDSVRRVVLTSSFAAIGKPKKGPLNGKLYTEEDWDDESELSSGYKFSKGEAERTAWALAKEHGLDLVVINPVLVIGPVLGSRAEATSINIVKDLTSGAREDILPRLVDVRDIARAHILGAEHPKAKGRYIVSWPYDTYAQQLLTALKERFPQYSFPDRAQDGKVEQRVEDPLKITRELGLHPLSPLESIVDMYSTMVAEGIVKPTSR